MRQKLAQERQYYEDHRAELMERYEGDFIAIKGDEVLCVVGMDNWCEMMDRDDVLVMLVEQDDGIHTFGGFREADIRFPTVDEIRNSAGSHGDYITLRFI